MTEGQIVHQWNKKVGEFKGKSWEIMTDKVSMEWRW